MNYDKYRELLEKSKPMVQQKPEKTIFSVGARGYYENPTTDLLAFFMNPQEEHGFDTLILGSFIESIGLPLDNLGTLRKPRREVLTANQKRIDLVLETDSWVMVIENKIYHHQNNPFAEYENYAQTSHPDKEAVFVVLSPEGKTPANWRAVSYENLINKINTRLGTYLTSNPCSKWVIFLKDFLLNLSQITVKTKMDNEAFEFIENNYLDVTNLFKLRNEYIETVQAQAVAQLKDLDGWSSVSTKIDEWGTGPAIRLYYNRSVSESNITINLNDQGHRIIVYVYHKDRQSVKSSDTFIEKNHHNKDTESGTIRYYSSKNRYTSFKDLLPELRETAQAMHNFLNQQNQPTSGV
ncbi:MAG: PD-(D/E)XK nuclease family protein [Thiomicrospira sp.]